MSPDPASIVPSRPRCPRCALPAAACLCHLVVAVDNAVEVLVLQHPREAGEAKGSARLLALGLARCRVEVGEVFDGARLHALLHGDGRRSVLLYPDVDAAPDRGARAAAPTQLVVLDATWRKSLRMLLSHPALLALPRLALERETAQAGAYGALRKARRPGQLSTLEAACTALDALEGASRCAPLVAAFERFVAERLARRSPP